MRLHPLAMLGILGLVGTLAASAASGCSYAGQGAGGPAAASFDGGPQSDGNPLNGFFPSSGSGGSSSGSINPGGSGGGSGGGSSSGSVNACPAGQNNCGNGVCCSGTCNGPGVCNPSGFTCPNGETNCGNNVCCSSNSGGAVCCNGTCCPPGTGSSGSSSGTNTCVMPSTFPSDCAAYYSDLTGGGTCSTCASGTGASSCTSAQGSCSAEISHCQSLCPASSGGGANPCTCLATCLQNAAASGCCASSADVFYTCVRSSCQVQGCK